METLLNKFESFIKRSMLPASVLLLFLSLLALKDETLSKLINNFNLLENQNFYSTIAIILILLISLSYIIAILTQFAFDNHLKKNFNSILFYKNENHTLNLLREKTILKLEQETNEFEAIEYTDYLLYQIIGRKLQFLKYPTNTKRYINDIKSSGSIFISMLILLFLEVIIHIQRIGLVLIGLIIMGGIFFIAKEYLLSKYRSRSIRIYTNYLLGDNNPI